MKRIILFFVLFSTMAPTAFAADNISLKWYGFVRSDFYINSRANEEAIDGVLHLFPKPIVLDGTGKDINAVPQAEMLSVATRMGLDIQGTKLFGATSTAKIEFDFAGTGALFFLVQLRQAYVQLLWENDALLVGQTWHPMFGSVSPTGVSFNSGSPFQPFNRSPQIRYAHQFGENFSLMGAALYQMQYTSNGPIGFSASYMKNSLTPNLHVNLEYNNKGIVAGVGLDYKRIKPDANSISSLSIVGYGQYIKSLLQIKAKAIWGQNLADYCMPGGYAKALPFMNDSFDHTWANMKNFNTWVNVVYGKQWQVGLFAGYMQNLGLGFSWANLHDFGGGYTVYGRGFYAASQEILDRLVRVAPMVIYNLNNLQLGLEYNLTGANYGVIGSNGRATNPYTVTNHRLLASVVYSF